MDEGIPFRNIVKLCFMAMGLVLIVLYISFQARHLIGGPQITIIDQIPLLQNERRIVLSGETFNISHLWINDRQIFTDAQGKFNEPLILENGHTVATLRAEDRYGRETEVTQTFVYVPASFLQ